MMNGKTRGWSAVIAAVVAAAGMVGVARAATLEARWQLDEQVGTAAADSSGNGHHGTYEGGVALSLEAPDAGQTSAGFDGVNDGVNVGTFLGSHVNDFTVAGWVKPTDVAGIERILAANRQSGGIGWGFGTNGSGLRFTTFNRQDYNSATGHLLGQTWKHVAVTFSAANTAEFYVNGSSIGTVSGSLPAAATADPFYIGRAGAGGTGAPQEIVNGRLGDIRFYSGTLSAGEVQTLATNPNLFAYWAMDETTGTTAGDSSGYHASGNLNGGYQNGVVLNQPAMAAGMGTAAYFDGSNDEVFLGSNTTRQTELRNLTQNFTVSAWIRPDRLTGTQRVVSQDAFDGNGWGFGLFGDELTLTTFSKFDYRTTLANLTVGEAVHITVAFEVTGSASTATFYVDGQLLESVTRTLADGSQYGAAKVGTRNWFIGSTGRMEYFQGLIDELRIYDRLLTSDEVAALATVPTPIAASAGAVLMGLVVSRRRNRG